MGGSGYHLGGGSCRRGPRRFVLLWLTLLMLVPLALPAVPPAGAQDDPNIVPALGEEPVAVVDGQAVVPDEAPVVVIEGEAVVPAEEPVAEVAPVVEAAAPVPLAPPPSVPVEALNWAPPR